MRARTRAAFNGINAELAHRVDLKDRIQINNHLGSLAQSRETHYITCWYLFDKETLKMWEGYGHDGVAIVSHYDLLKEALERRIIDETHVGLVQYGIAHLTNRFNAPTRWCMWRPFIETSWKGPISRWIAIVMARTTRAVVKKPTEAKKSRSRRDSWNLRV
jgi:hypothetical protein